MVKDLDPLRLLRLLDMRDLKSDRSKFDAFLELDLDLERLEFLCLERDDVLLVIQDLRSLGEDELSLELDLLLDRHLSLDFRKIGERRLIGLEHFHDDGATELERSYLRITFLWFDITGGPGDFLKRWLIGLEAFHDEGATELARSYIRATLSWLELTSGSGNFLKC